MTTPTNDSNPTTTTTLLKLPTGSTVRVTLATPPLTSPPPPPPRPTIIIIPGVGGNSHQFPSLIRRLSLSLPYPVLIYDRFGLGLSPHSSSTNPVSLQGIVDDIFGVLKALQTDGKVEPPYILVGHSWGGMLSTHFTSQSPPDTISGMVLLDSGAPTPSNPPTSTSDSSSSSDTGPAVEHRSFFTDPGSPWSHPCILTCIRGLPIMQLTQPQSTTSLTQSEYDALISYQATPEYAAASGREFDALQASYVPFRDVGYFGRSPPVFSGTPIAIVCGHAYASYRTIYEMAVEKKTGTEEDREKFAELLGAWKERVRTNQRLFLSLTEEENGKEIEAKAGTGHLVQMGDVESVVEGVRWVVERAG